MSKRSVWRIGMIGLVLLLGLAGCGPEGTRVRGEGLGTGADVNNYTSEFRPRSKVFPGESQP